MQSLFGWYDDGWMADKDMIIDCFPFFDELDLLEIRLNELRDVVDVFVLTESPYTFTGIEKPLYFQDNKERFKGFNIAHTVYHPAGKYRPAAFEKHQKQYNLDYAYNLFSPGDIIIQGDCDEIPKAEVVSRAAKDENWRSAGLAMRLSYYYINCVQINRNKSQLDSRLLRPDKRISYNARQNDPVDKIYEDAGWHFSFLGNIQYKLESWNHAPEYDRPPYNTPEHIKKCKEQGLDLFMRKGRRRIEFEFVNDLSYLPEYVLKNREGFDKYIKWN